jgi:hypothetical protein
LEKAREMNLDGDPGRIDPDVPLEYQTEFLPYDKKWEFPRKRLRLGSCFPFSVETISSSFNLLA